MWAGGVWAVAILLIARDVIAAPSSAWIQRRERQLDLWNDRQPNIPSTISRARSHRRDFLQHSAAAGRQLSNRPWMFPGAVLGGRVISLHAANGITQDRGLLCDRNLRRNGTMVVEGSSAELGYFFVVVHIGSPGKPFTLIVDTGSSITFVPCEGCDACGPYHDDAFFDPLGSSTARHVQCDNPECQRGFGSYSCRPNGPDSPSGCWYEINYAEGSNSKGWMLVDQFAFPDDQRSVPFAFGCETSEGGMIHDQEADGIMGMDRSRDAFHSQLNQAGIMDDIFGLCFGVPSGGTMILGDIPPLPEMQTQWTPLRLSDPQFYHVDLKSITLAGRTLEVEARSYTGGRLGCILDSGTTFTYLPDGAYIAFLEVIQAAADAAGLPSVEQPNPDLEPPDICWGGASTDYESLSDFFPTGEFVFDGARLALRPWQYLFRHFNRRGAWCLAMYGNGATGTLIGGITVRDVLVTYDVRNKRVGFADVPPAVGGCSGLKDELAKASDAARDAPRSPSLPPPSSPLMVPPSPPRSPTTPRARPPRPPGWPALPRKPTALPVAAPPSLSPPPPPPPPPLATPPPSPPPPPTMLTSPSPPVIVWSQPPGPAVVVDESTSTSAMVFGVIGGLLVGGAVVGAVFMVLRARQGARRWQALDATEDGYEASLAMRPLGGGFGGGGGAAGLGGGRAGDAGGGFVSRNGWPLASDRSAEYRLVRPTTSAAGPAAPPKQHPPVAGGPPASSGATFTIDEEGDSYAGASSTAPLPTRPLPHFGAPAAPAPAASVPVSYQPPDPLGLLPAVEMIPIVEADAASPHLRNQTDLLNFDDDLPRR